MKKLLVSLLLSSCAVFAQQAASKAASADSAAKAPGEAQAKVDKAAAYYHFTMAHMYEEEMAAYGRSDLVSKAIEEYRLALQADPNSEYLTSGLAELYARTGRIRDAVNEAQDL